MNKESILVYCNLLRKVFDDLQGITVGISIDTNTDDYIKGRMRMFRQYHIVGKKILNNIEEENQKEEQDE